VAACRNLKDAGYMIALDDYGANHPREALLGQPSELRPVFQLNAGA
jgi:hypothetical protein